MLTIYPLPWLGLPHIPRPRTPLSPYDLFKPFQSGCIITFVPCSLDRTHSQPTLSSYFIYLAQSIIASSINRLFSSPFSLIVDLFSLLFVSHCIHTPPHTSNLRLAHHTHTSFVLHNSPYLPQHISPIAIFGTYVQYCNVLSFIIVHLMFSLSRCGRHAARGHTLVARADLINPRPRAADHVCSRNADIASEFRAICWGR